MSFASMLNQTVYIEPAGALDAYGNTSFGAPVSYKARFQETTKTIVTPERERQPIDGVVFLAPAAIVEIGSRVTYGGKQYRIMRRDVITAGNGQTHHYELMVQLWSYA